MTPGYTPGIIFAASGVNNAIARAAGLFAIAGFGVLAAAAFKAGSGAAAPAGYGGWSDWTGAAAAEPHVFAQYQSAMRASFEMIVVVAVGLCVLGAAMAAFFLTSEVEGERGRETEIRSVQRFNVFSRGFGRVRGREPTR
ncbi:MAG: hypothetical protein AAGL49_05160 [Pseudomonadota bacterium]